MQRKLNLMFFGSAKRGQEGHIPQYLSNTDLIHLSQVSQYAHQCSKEYIRQTCFKQFLTFLLHPDILGKPIHPKIPLEKYPNKNKLDRITSKVDFSKKISHLLERINTLLIVDFKINKNEPQKFMTDAYKLLLVPEIFLLTDLHKSIQDNLKKISLKHSQKLVLDMLNTFSNESKDDAAIRKLGKEYTALPYTDGYLGIDENLNMRAYIPEDKHTYNNKFLGSLLSYDKCLAKNIDDNTLQFLYDHNILHFYNSKKMGHNEGSGYYRSPIIKAAFHGYLKLFELSFQSTEQRAFYMFDFGAGVAVMDSRCTPLIAAARGNEKHIVKRILADKETTIGMILQRDEKLWTAFTHAACHGYIEVMDLMIQKALSLGDPDFVSHLVNNDTEYYQNDNKPLIIAAKFNQLEAIKRLMPFVKKYIRIHDVHNKLVDFDQIKAALELATSKGHTEVMAFLQPYVEQESKAQCRLM